MTPDTDKKSHPRYDIPPKNADFNQRVIAHCDELEWVATDSRGVSIRVLEAVQLGEPRLTMMIRFSPGSYYDLRRYNGGEEFVVLEGSLNDENGIYDTGCYVRNPVGTHHILTSAGGCLLFAKMGEFASSDHEHRLIETHTEALWMAGPVEGTSVLPLHMHDTRSVLMIRWDQATGFKPGLDPQGEELFVISGKLSDYQGSYRKGSWIRNPVEQWQSWDAIPGTIVYYKNGHFPNTATAPVR